MKWVFVGIFIIFWNTVGNFNNFHFWINFQVNRIEIQQNMTINYSDKQNKSNEFKFSSMLKFSIFGDFLIGLNLDFWFSHRSFVWWYLAQMDRNRYTTVIKSALKPISTLWFHSNFITFNGYAVTKVRLINVFKLYN